MGRQMQQTAGQPPQIVLTVPLLEGLTGDQKMSKSLGNYVGITEPAEEMFGKLMSISDERMWRYFDLLSFRSIARNRAADAAGLRTVRIRAISSICWRGDRERFHDAAAAALQEMRLWRVTGKRRCRRICRWSRLTRLTGRSASAICCVTPAWSRGTSEALRMIAQGAVRIDGERVADRDLQQTAGSEHVYQVGKRRFARVRLK